MHEKLLDKLNEFFIVGGMPEAVASFIEKKDFKKVAQIHRSILDTYRNDFSKYRDRVPLVRLERVFDYAAFSVGEKVKYSAISRDEQARELRVALELLSKAQVIHMVHHSNVAGIPVKAGMDDRVFKLLFLDVGLMNHAIGLDWESFQRTDRSMLLPWGKIAEQFIGQQLLFRSKGTQPPELFYWVREGKMGNAEVDFLIQLGTLVLPIEVKAGKGGWMKSIAQLMYEKGLSFAIRFDRNPPSLQQVSYKLAHPVGNEVKFQVLTVPLYAVGHSVEWAQRLGRDVFIAS